MLEEIDKRLDKEVERILQKDILTNEEIEFLFNTRTRLESIQIQDVLKIQEEENKKRMNELTRNMLELSLNP